MSTRTKIICTIGPAVNSFEKMIELIRAGMNIARLNFSHGSHETHAQTIEWLKQARNELGVPLGIMLDTRGPEVRIGQISGDHTTLSTGKRWNLIKDEILGDHEKVTIKPGYILDNLSLGERILFDDGYISSTLVEKNQEGVVVEIDNGGIIRSGKGVNIPNVRLGLPSITDKDINDIKFGCAHGVDYIAVSFVRSPENIVAVKNLLLEQDAGHILVIAKIENHEGVENIDTILQVADGVMIARGDLGVEIPLSKVPRLQKEMIRKCYLAGKPSVTATQMLESMINNPRPTRAEVSDVANAIYDSTSAVMLSGETAVGQYPAKTVQVMKSIIKEAEIDFNYQEFFNLHSSFIYNDVPSSVTLAAVKTAYSSNATVICAFTNSGATARLISRLRPDMPIIAMTALENTYHQMALYWGVVPYLCNHSKTFQEAFLKISQFALEKNLVSYGDLVIVIGGSTFGITGTTNMMVVENIGDVLVRGHSGLGERVYGNVIIILSSEEGIDPYNARGRILVITKCSSSYLPYLKEAAGVILQNHVDDENSENFAMEQAKILKKPLIVRADAACNILHNGQLVTLDPVKALIYKGVVLS